MAEDVLDRVRTRCAEVARVARWVRIDEERVAGYARALADSARPPSLDPKHHYLGADEETAAFVVALDAVNFGSGYWPHVRKLPGLSGYFTVATRLKEEFERSGPLDAARLAALEQAEAARIFGQPADGPAGELMGLFARALNDLGRLLLAEHGGSVASLVLAARGSAVRLVELLTAMPFYRDVARYRGIEVPLYKRAQLTAADLSVALPGSPLGRFHDLDRLTIFADNLVPHVLRLDGVLVYDPALAARIDREEPLEAGSEEETEIRACGLHAVEAMVAALRAEGRRATAMELDYVLWNRGQLPEIKAVPRHRAPSVFY